MQKPLGQLMLDLEGLTVNDVERELLQNPNVGGVILFARNYKNPSQLAELVRQIRQARDPILIAVDQEGGRVQRFREQFADLSPLGDLGKKFDEDPQAAKELAAQHAILMASELKAFDIDLSFTPVLDRDCGLSTIIGNRAFHQDPIAITELARVYIEAMHQESMPATGKHFPGHGGVAEDSHEELPTDHREYSVIAVQDLLPFKALATQLDAIMPAHIIFSAVDDKPVGFSAKWLREILRTELGFDGVIFSDDLTMKATESYGDYPERARLALEAGCDMVLVCNNPVGAKAVLDNWPVVADAKASSARLERLLALCQTNPQMSI